MINLCFGAPSPVSWYTRAASSGTPNIFSGFRLVPRWYTWLWYTWYTQIRTLLAWRRESSHECRKYNSLQLITIHFILQQYFKGMHEIFYDYMCIHNYIRSRICDTRKTIFRYYCYILSFNNLCKKIIFYV